MHIRRSLAAGLVLALLTGGLLAPSGAAPRGREATATYAFDPTQGGLTAWFSNDMGLFFGEEVVFPTRKGETTVDITVADDSGHTMAAAVWQTDTTYVICEGAEEIPIRGVKPVYVQIFLELTPSMYEGCEVPALPTTGTVTALFHSDDKVTHKDKHTHKHDH